MTGLLMVPIHLDALCVGPSGAHLIAPLADFTKIPYASWVSKRPLRPHARPTISSQEFNSDYPFTSQRIMREPAKLDQYTANYVPQATGIHLHWSLPDALTVMRADPDSNNRMRFPQVPNRWLITSKIKQNGKWQIESEWVVESDYLYPEQGTVKGVTVRPAITFPIVPLDQYQKVLTNSPPNRARKPADVTDPDYNAVYSAPFRYMGRALPLADWKNAPKTSEYLSKYLPDGLTAVGYGDPLFAAIYTNCFSVFGFVHTGADNSQTRSYDILGWYENTSDCLELFASLARQKPNTKLYEALTSEYKWKVENTPADFPTLSLYYASIELEAELTANPAIAGATQSADGPPGYSHLTVAIGNTGTEALSADLASTLAEGDTSKRFIIEDQLEAIGLRHDLGDSAVDLEARFREARHTKGFQPRTGGTIWSIQLRRTSNLKDADDAGPSSSPTLPPDLAHDLNDLNLRQADYDAAWKEIETLRQHVFADWHKFANAHNFSTSTTTVIYTRNEDVPEAQRHAENPTLAPTWENLKAGTILPTDFISDDDEILKYIQDGSLAELQLRLAQAGVLEIGKDVAGRITLAAGTANDNPYVGNQSTLAQSVLLKLRELSSRLDQQNSRPAMQQAQQEFFMLRKSAPRFWQPNEPVVLFKGAAVSSTVRHGEDGRANDDDTLTCQVLSVPTALDNDGIGSQLRTGDPNQVIKTIQDTIKSLQKASPTLIGFSHQTEEPWNPISLEWEVSVWPETHGMDPHKNEALAGVDYQPGFISANYEFDDNASNLLLSHMPSQFGAGETENVYTGRTTLTPSASGQLRFNITQYLMSLTLSDLKSAITGPAEIAGDLDYGIDKNLIAWAQQHFTLSDVPELKDPATIAGPDKEKSISRQQEVVASWYRTQHIFRIPEKANGKVTTNYRLVDFSDRQHFPDTWYGEKPALTGAAPQFSLTTWSALSPGEQTQDPVHTALSAYTALTSTNVLAQSLGGFNNALIMRQQIPQLPIFDLNALFVAIQESGVGVASDQKYRELARDVSYAVAGGNNSSPVTNSDFLPIRSGLMKVNKLYLVDTFGQVLNVSPSTILPSDTLTISRNAATAVSVTAEQDASFVYLAPRLTQPARLNFRWLTAAQGSGSEQQEMNDHPASSPVCGWLIPNHLDGSLMFYDEQGISLGSILQNGVWEPAPGTVNRLLIGAIPNPHLRQLATFLTTSSQQENNYWDNFLTALNTALENIDPANFAQHQALALLIGRPIAVVRASLSLQLAGKPALNQNWHALLHDMYKGMVDSRVNNGFTNVDFPVRLGEYKQLNDGLVGYWIEDGNTYKDNKFYSSQAEQVNSPTIITNHGSAIVQNLRPDTAPLNLTMLIDPRGEIHVTSAVLPTKKIGVPPDQYAQVLQKLSVNFMTGPILTDETDVRLNLPQESGYSWSWLMRASPSVWQQTEQIKTADNSLKFTPQRLVGGWLKLTPDQKKS